MKYLHLRDIDTVTNALNFSTPDCHVIGGCDIYTIKAAGSDKKLYKRIEHSLESQYESLVCLSASLSPPSLASAMDDGNVSSPNDHRSKRSRTVEPPKIDLSRDSPFGPLSQVSARRTFAYLIATLNASHSDYDFSKRLRPSDFKKERSLRSIMQNVDSTLQNLRPKPHAFYLAQPLLSPNAPIVANSMGNELWSPRMWTLIDNNMGLRQCERYSYAPDDDPFAAGDGTAIWSMHYFFFNKQRKRVCYLYLRGLSVISHSPVYAPAPVRRKMSSLSVGEGACKRASYWLGERVLDGKIDTTFYADDDDDEQMVTSASCDDDEDEVEVPQMSLDDIRSEVADGYYSYDTVDDDYDGFGEDVLWGSRRSVRGVSEEVADAMEM